MKFNTIAIAAVLTLAPGFAMAAGCNWSKTEQTVMSCADGFVVDEATGACVAQTTS